MNVYPGNLLNRNIQIILEKHFAQYSGMEIS